MADKQKSYADTVAPPVGWGDDDATAEQVIRASLARAQYSYVASGHMFKKRMGAGRDTDAHLIAMLSWSNAIHTFLLESVTADLLILIGSLAPDKADEIARNLVGKIESGDYYPEQVWEWLTERGIDPERIRTETEAAIAAEEK